MQDDARHLVTRTITLAKAAEAGALTRAGTLEGVVAIHGTAGTRRLSATYDLERTDIGRLAGDLDRLGLTPANGWLARLIRAWVTFQDDNLKAQSRIVHHCCSVPPDRE